MMSIHWHTSVRTPIVDGSVNRLSPAAQSAVSVLPSSLGEHYLHPENAMKGYAAFDEAARAGGRDPTEIGRALNVGPRLRELLG